MSLSFASMAQVPQQPPVWGYDKQDVGNNGQMSYVAPTLVGNVSASGGVQDLASAGIQIDTSIPLKGFLTGLAILVAIRVLWEAMEE
jgi:hypothetical protein